MMLTMKNPALVAEYEHACNLLARNFAWDYFEEEEWEWAGNPGEIALINDYYLDFQLVVDSYRYGAAPEDVTGYHDLLVETKGVPGISYRNYVNSRS